MGYETFLIKYPKYEGFTPRDYYIAEEYIKALHNPWVKKNYKSVDDYIESNFDKSFPSDEIDFFKAFEKEDEYKCICISTELGWWGRNSSIIFDMIKNHCNSKDYTISLSKEDIEFFIDYFLTRIDELLGGFISINNSFKKDDDENIIVMKCDGIETVDNNGNIKRIYTDGEYGCEDSYYIENGEDFSLNLSFLKAFIKALTETDFEKEVILLEASF